MARRTSSAPARCPHCDARVPPRAPACPACGSDARSGWSDDADAWAGDLPGGYGGGDDDEFDDEAYQEFLRAEGLADDGIPSAAARRRAWLTVVVLLLVACILIALIRH